jgi:hypothetical protein
MNNVTKKSDPYKISSDLSLAWHKAKREGVSVEILNQMAKAFELALAEDRIKNGYKPQIFARSSKRWQTDANGNTHFVS